MDARFTWLCVWQAFQIFSSAPLFTFFIKLLLSFHQRWTMTVKKRRAFFDKLEMKNFSKRKNFNQNFWRILTQPFTFLDLLNELALFTLVQSLPLYTTRDFTHVRILLNEKALMVAPSCESLAQGAHPYPHPSHESFKYSGNLLCSGFSRSLLKRQTSPESQAR